MNKTEMAKLEKLVKGRFKILGEQIAQRDRELRDIIQKEVEEEFSDLTVEAEKEVGKLEAKIEKIQLEEQTLETERSKLISEYANKGIEPTSRYKQKGQKTKFMPKDLTGIVARRANAFKSEKGAAQLNLGQQEQKVLEDLFIHALETDDALQFLERVPTVEDYVPLPEGTSSKAKELTSG